MPVIRRVICRISPAKAFRSVRRSVEQIYLCRAWTNGAGELAGGAWAGLVWSGPSSGRSPCRGSLLAPHSGTTTRGRLCQPCMPTHVPSIRQKTDGKEPKAHGKTVDLRPGPGGPAKRQPRNAARPAPGYWRGGSDQNGGIRDRPANRPKRTIQAALSPLAVARPMLAGGSTRCPRVRRADTCVLQCFRLC